MKISVLEQDYNVCWEMIQIIKMLQALYYHWIWSKRNKGNHLGVTNFPGGKDINGNSNNYYQEFLNFCLSAKRKYLIAFVAITNGNLFLTLEVSLSSFPIKTSKI